jgi:hypothetical protein
MPVKPHANGRHERMTRNHRTWFSAYGLACVLASVAACRQVVGFDGSRATDAGMVPATPLESDTDAGRLFDPKPPWLSGAECTQCTDEHCQAEHAACLADDFCSRWRKDATELDRPALIAVDFLHQLEDAQWAFEQGGADVTTAWTTAGACVANHCTTACELGRDFSCVGKFDWPRSYPKRIEIRLMIWDGPISPASSFDGWRVRACARQSLCQRPLGEAMTHGGGLATLTVDFSLAPPGAVLPEFFGFLLLDGGGPDFPPSQVDVSGPFFDGDYWGLYVPSRALMLNVTQSRRLPDDPSRGVLQIWPWDCTVNSEARAVTAEVWNYDEAGLVPCTDCRIYYPDDSGFPDVNLTDFSSATVAPAVTSAAPGDIMIVVRDTKTRLPLSVMRPVTIRAGHVHTIHLMPASKDELANLPKQAR